MTHRLEVNFWPEEREENTAAFVKPLSTSFYPAAKTYSSQTSIGRPIILILR